MSDVKSMDWTSIFAAVLSIIGADFLAAKLRKNGGAPIHANYLKNHARYVALFSVNALQNAAAAFRWSTPESVLDSFKRLVVNPNTGNQVNIYSLEKAAQWLQAWDKNTFSPAFCDKYTLAILASMSAHGYAMNTRTMQAACCKDLRATTGESFGKLKLRLVKGAKTADTQQSSTCNMLAAFGFAAYDGHTLTVRESDKYTRRAIAALDKLSADDCVALVGACSGSTFENGRAE